MARASTSWAPGQSGNPGGRPKKGRALVEILRRAVAAKGDDGIPYRRALVEQLVKMAVGGDLGAIKEVFDRLDGKAIAALELSGPDGGDIRIKGYGTASPDDWPPADSDV